LGFFSSTGTKIRNILRVDKERLPLELAKGNTASTAPSNGYEVHSYSSELLGDVLRLETDLVSRYVEYEEMDEVPDVVNALDIYADDISQIDAIQNKCVWVDSPDETVSNILNDLFEKRLRINEEIWGYARYLCKYGSVYNELVVNNDGIIGLNFLHAPSVRRVEGRRGELYGFVQDVRRRFGFSSSEFKQMLNTRMSNPGEQSPDTASFEDWEVSHIRLQGKEPRSLYGVSVLEGARHAYRRLLLTEDAMLIYRLQRAPQRLIYYVDVGDKTPQETNRFLEQYKQKLKKTKYFNPQTGKLDLRAGSIAPDEDIFVPVRKGNEKTSNIDVLPSPMWNSTEDTEYFRLKMLGALKVPKTYLGYEGSPSKSSLSGEDVRFAKTILRIQRELRDGLRKIARVHLAALGIDPASVEYEIYMTIPSAVFELAQLEVRNAKAMFAAQMSNFVSLHWILQKIFLLSDDEIEFIIKERHEEQLADADVQAKGQGMLMAVMQPPQPGVLGPNGQPVTSAAPPSGQQEDQRKRLRDIASMSSLWPQKGHLVGPKNITEKELFAGNKDHEKRLEDNFQKMMSNNKELASQINNLGALMHEIKYAMRSGMK
jgi:hypothetical protein